MFLFWSDLFVVGRVVNWKRWESSELGRWERCMRVVRLQVGKGGKVVRWQTGKARRVARREIPGLIRGWGTLGESKISSFFF